MGKHHEHLHCLHGILRRTATDQMMFAFVRGVLSCRSDTSVMQAIRMFEQEFCIEDFNANSAKWTYYRMLKDYIPQNSIFNEKQKQAKLQNGGRPSCLSQSRNPGGVRDK